MFRIFRKSLKTGVVTTTYPKDRKAAPRGFMGVPVWDHKTCTGCGRCAKSCPASAISLKDRGDDFAFYLDTGGCIFCGTCARVCPEGAMTISCEFELASKTKNHLVFKGNGKGTADETLHFTDPEMEQAGHNLGERIKKVFGRSLAVRQVSAGSCNACEVECLALTNPYYDVERLGIHFVASPRHADALLVTGPPSRQMELALRKTYDATPDPKMVIAMGACAINGGIFKGSYAVVDGVDRVIPVDLYIPGCPPRPQAIIYGLSLLLDRIEK